MSKSSLLDVAVVEGIYSATISGRTERVARVVSELQDATLPGLVEYLCIQRSAANSFPLPPLPYAVQHCAVGTALQKITCPFGLRASGSVTRNCSVNPSEAEFFFLRTAADYESKDYRLFETRWARAGAVIGLRTTNSLMQLAMTAMSENGILHANSPDGVLVGYRILPNAVMFTVADLGRGVLGSLKSNKKYAEIAHHRDAMRLALCDGVTCLDTPGGTGFRQLFKTLANQYGTIRFRTGDVCITMDGQNFESSLGEETFPETITGFQVTMCCRTISDSSGSDNLL